MLKNLIKISNFISNKSSIFISHRHCQNSSKIRHPFSFSPSSAVQFFIKYFNYYIKIKPQALILQKARFYRLLPFPFIFAICEEKNQIPVQQCQSQSSIENCHVPGEPPSNPSTCVGKTPLNCAPSQEDLSHNHLIKQACVVAVDSVMRVISQVIIAIEDYHVQYRDLVCSLMDLMEDSRNAEGHRLELIDCKIIGVRSKIEDMKCAIIEIETYLESVNRLACAAIETSYLGDSEISSAYLSERLEFSNTRLVAIKEETANLERDLNQLKALIIIETGKGLLS